MSSKPATRGNGERFHHQLGLKLLKDWRPVNGTVVNHAAPCVTVIDFRETTNVGKYKCILLDESLDSC